MKKILAYGKSDIRRWGGLGMALRNCVNLVGFGSLFPPPQLICNWTIPSVLYNRFLLHSLLEIDRASRNKIPTLSSTPSAATHTIIRDIFQQWPQWRRKGHIPWIYNDGASLPTNKHHEPHDQTVTFAPPELPRKMGNPMCDPPQMNDVGLCLVFRG